MDTRTYLEWNGDTRAMKLFWRKLARAMYKRNKTSSHTSQNGLTSNEEEATTDQRDTEFVLRGHPV